MNKELIRKLRDPQRTDRWELTNKAADHIEELHEQWEQIYARHNVLVKETTNVRERLEVLKRERAKLNAVIAEQSSRIEDLERALRIVASGFEINVPKFVTGMLDGNNLKEEATG